MHAREEQVHVVAQAFPPRSPKESVRTFETVNIYINLRHAKRRTRPGLPCFCFLCEVRRLFALRKFLTVYFCLRETLSINSKNSPSGVNTEVSVCGPIATDWCCCVFVGNLTFQEVLLLHEIGTLIKFISPESCRPVLSVVMPKVRDVLCVLYCTTQMQFPQEKTSTLFE